MFRCRSAPERGIVLVGREHERRAAAPAAHQLGRDQLLLLRRLAVLAEELAKLPNMLLQPAIGHVAAVPRENFRLRAVGCDSIFVGIAKNELARFQRLASAWRRFHAVSFNGRL